MSCRKRLYRTKLLTIVLGISALFGTSAARAASSTPVNVSVSLRPIISLSVFQDLNFGDLIVGVSPSGLFEIRPDGTIAFSGSGLTPTASVSPQAGQINMVGEQGMSIDVSCESAVLSNALAETFDIGISIAAAAQAQSFACSGLGTSVLTVPQTETVSSVYVGGTIDASDLAGLTSYELFSSAIAAGSPAVFQAVYQ